MIEKYFSEYTRLYHDMKKALKRYVDAQSDFYTLTGIRYDDMPKAKGKSLGFDDLMIKIEELYNVYLELYENSEKEREKCLNDINKLSNPIHRVIIEYAYLNFESNKEIALSLQEYHNKSYSLSYISEIKTTAIREFEKII